LPPAAIAATIAAIPLLLLLLVQSLCGMSHCLHSSSSCPGQLSQQLLLVLLLVLLVRASKGRLLGLPLLQCAAAAATLVAPPCSCHHLLPSLD
jgi:hypothetical protein